VLKEYAAMGSPIDPTPAQVEQLNRETALSPPEQSTLHGGKLDLTLTPNALVLVKVSD
jgi:xylan 1,4-beta-xylosidase